jgi:hypothetical protein
MNVKDCGRVLRERRFGDSDIDAMRRESRSSVGFVAEDGRVGVEVIT